MTFRPSSLGIAGVVAVLVAGLLGALPLSSASAATPALKLASQYVAITSAGDARIRVRCTSTRTCSGSVGLQPAGNANRKFTSYSVKAGALGWLDVKAADIDNPWKYAATGEVNNGRPGTLYFVEKSPSARSTQVPVTTERRVYSRELKGTLSGTGPVPSDVTITAEKLGSGGTPVEKNVRRTGPGSFSFDLPLGPNNTAAGEWVLRVRALVDGTYRTWFWRGSNGVARGGVKEIREASRIVATREGDFTADLRYGAISGIVRYQGNPDPGAEVTVAAAPVTFAGSRTRRNLDIESCANIHDSVKTDAQGRYTVGFLPYDTQTADKRYVVQADDDRSFTVDRWNDQFGSCLHAINYTTGDSPDRTNLLAVTGSLTPTPQDFEMRGGKGDLYAAVSYAGFSLQPNDRYVTLREYLPGRPVLDAPVRYVRANGQTKSFDNLAPGKYWLEVGRRTGCAAWYQSRYPNNYNYHQGDRYSERWKSFPGSRTTSRAALSAPDGLTGSTFPSSGRRLSSGYKGWMYRNHCRTNTAGSYGSLVTVTDANDADADGTRVTVNRTVKRGATISGRVTRAGGKSPKEMMVSAYSVYGELVMRTAITDGSGRFTIFGLQSGNYRITVNADSWRGITRTFSGPKTKRVSAGNNYSVGTLRFAG